ncbi:MAG: transporter [Gammaproteobacteria bacterium]|nr:transporter [Gammaproteobacteria bacterium]
MAAEGADLGLVGQFFQYLGDQPFLFIFIALALGYPIGKISFAGISLGSTAGTLIAGIVMTNIAFLGFDIKYSIPGLVSTIALMMFMYAIGLKVGPQFFSGLARNGVGLMVIAVITVVINWVICFGGASLMGLDPGYAAGMISGSFTVTAVIGVAQSAIESGAWTPPPGMDIEQVGANLAAGYAISYILSSLGIILTIKYLPRMFGHDPVEEGKKAEEEYGGGEGSEALPGSEDSFVMGYMPFDLRAYRLENDEFIGRSVKDLYGEFPDSPVLRVQRGEDVIDIHDNPTLQRDDIITARADVEKHIKEGSRIGVEVDDPRARNIDMEVAEIVVGKSEIAGQTLQQIRDQRLGFGLYLKSLFRAGAEIPALPETVIETGDVLRLIAPPWSLEMAAEKLGSKVVTATATTEVMYMAIAMSIGFMVGQLSVKVAGIPFALGTSAGIIMAGIIVSTLRTRNPNFGGPVSNGARDLLQDLGLNMFIAVLAANVGSKIINSFAGGAALKIAVIGTLAALVPTIIAWLYGYYMLKMNPVVLAGACAGGRNSTPAMRGIQDESKSSTPAIGYPVPYCVSTILVLIGGYIAMLLS